jgi:hypothetical protein
LSHFAGGLFAEAGSFGKMTHLGQIATYNRSSEINGQVANCAEFSPIAALSASVNLKKAVFGRLFASEPGEGRFLKNCSSSGFSLLDKTYIPPNALLHSTIPSGIFTRVVTSHPARLKAPSKLSDSHEESGSFGAYETTTALRGTSASAFFNISSLISRGRPSF